MNVYADTNFLVRLYADPMQTGEARDLLYSEPLDSEWPIPVTNLLAMEFRNALQRLVFESAGGGQWRITRENAAMNQAFFEDHIADGCLLETNAVNLADVEPVFVQLCQRHTANHGFRTYDLLHVSTALVLGSEWFLSFDKKANRLAELEGLRTV